MTIFLIVLCLFCATVHSQQTIQDVIDAGQCNSGVAASGLSNQIITLSQKMKKCFYSDTTNIVELDGKSPISIPLVLERDTSLKIEALFSSNNQKLSLTYGLVGLPEFYIFNSLYKKNSACASQDLINLLSTSYSDCRLCAGNAFFTSSASQLKLFQSNLSFDVKSDNVIIYSSSLLDFKREFVNSFQNLWNCNHPEDQIQLSGNFDIQTEQRLKLSPVDGFSDICMQCEIQNCGKCTSDFKSCKACKDTYTLNPDGTCTNCSDSNCSSCNQGLDANGQKKDICTKCKTGMFLIDGACVAKCPSQYTQTESHCLECKVGTYGSGSQCIDCDKYCKNCTGPKPSDCKTCFDGFIQDPNGGCKQCPTGQCCGSVQCDKDEYRQTVYPYECKKCGNNCATCTGPDAKQCLTCSNGYILDNGFCMNPSPQVNSFVDTTTNTPKPCHFSCEECIDSSSSCTKCKIDFNYFIPVPNDTKVKCFTQCPNDFEPETGISSTNYVKCVVKSTLSSSDLSTSVLIQAAKNRCVSSQYWDVDAKKCLTCASNCLSCTDNDNCDQCAEGMYWNASANLCSPCHSSCTSCTGPSHSQCLKCKNINGLFSNNGVCDSMASTPSSSITTPQSNQFKSSNLFDPNSQLYNLKLGVSQFTTQNPLWINESLVNSKNCTFANFKNLYQSLNDPNISCQDYQLSRSTIQSNGSMVTIYAMILSLSGVQIDGKGVNPQSLAKYIISNTSKLPFYGFFASDEFACSQLTCVSNLETYLSGLSVFNNVKVSIKQSRQIRITSQGKNVDCFATNSSIDDSKISEIDMTVLYASQSLKTSNKQYFVLDVCGKDLASKSNIQKQYFVTNYFGNGYFETVGAHLPEGQQTQVFYIGGASADQNSFAKNNNSKYINNFESYKVSVMRVIEVEEVDGSVDKVAKSYSQIVGNVKLDTSTPSKCNCISNTVDYIIANEDTNNELIPIITPQNTFLSKNIDAFSIKHITSQFNLDLDLMKSNNLNVSSIVAKKIFTKVIDEVTANVTKCYSLTKAINQCLQNTLIDIAFSNRQNCLNQKEISDYVSKSNYDGVIRSIQSSQWCSVNSDRCAKNVQIIKGCL